MWVFICFAHEKGYLERIKDTACRINRGRDNDYGNIESEVSATFLVVQYDRTILEEETIESVNKFEPFVLDINTPLESQAAKVMARVQEILHGQSDSKTDLHLLVEDGNFPTALYEAIMGEFDPSKEAKRWNFQKPITVFPKSQESTINPFDHKNKHELIHMKDRLFSLYLFDDEERDSIKRALISPCSVLITGKRGTGKSLLARYIHYHTLETANGNFVEINFSEISEDNFESSIKGVKKNTFTEVGEQIGLLEKANKGTLFIDEIAESSKDKQAKLLKYIYEHIHPVDFYKLGSPIIESAEVRFIAATNLEPETFKERFRKDLKSRFSVSIRIKDMYDKEHSLDFFKRALDHFTTFEYIYKLEQLPSWDTDAIEKVYKQRKLPDNLRDIHSLVKNILSQRKQKGEIVDRKIEYDDIKSACDKLSPVDSKSEYYQHNSNTHGNVDIQALSNILFMIEKTDTIRGLNNLTISEAQEIIYRLKHTALRLSLLHPTGKSTNGSMKLYGMSNTKSFKDLCDNPKVKLHPEGKSFS